MADTTNNKEKFLNHLADRLGTPRHSLGDKKIEAVHDLAQTTLTDKTQDELLEIAKEKCKTIHTPVVEVNYADLLPKLEELIADYGDGNLLFPDDNRFKEFELDSLLAKEDAHTWKRGNEFRDENIRVAADTNVAVAFAEFFLAESGSVVVESNAGQGRSLHFLPKRYISIIPKSKIVPRSTQAAAYYTEKRERGEETGAIHFISGPSNSGDIEMQLVVGVHGPLEVTYLVVMDK